MKILFRTDASVEIGTGHVMRCLTLAKEIRAQGGEAVFICREHRGNLLDRIKNEGFSVKALKPSEASTGDLAHSKWLGATQSEDVQASLKAVGNAKFDWLVVDHYALDSRWQTPMRGVVKKLFIIDDIADRTHAADILLDQNLYSNMESRYNGKLLQNTEILLGPQYALLRGEYLGAHETAKVRNSGLSEILVFYGGADPTGETLVALEALFYPQFKNLQVRVVVGPSNPAKEKIQALCQNRPNTKYFYSVASLADLMSHADLSLGAGGTTTWERCTTGLPALITMIAENQEEMSLEGARVGFQELAGRSGEVTPEKIRRRLSELMKSPEILQKMSEVGLRIVDAKGTQRVVGAMRRRV